MVFFSCLGFAIAGESEHAHNNILNKRITIYGGARLFNADGAFSSGKEGRPAIQIGMDDLGVDEARENLESQSNTLPLPRSIFVRYTKRPPAASQWV